MSASQLFALVAMLALAGTAAGAQDSTRTTVRDTTVTNQLRAYWRDRMGLAERGKPAVCITGHWEMPANVFMIDSLSKPARRCEFPTWQGAIGFAELMVTTTYDQQILEWKLLMEQHPGCLFLGAVVGLTKDQRPILWGTQRH